MSCDVAASRRWREVKTGGARDLREGAPLPPRVCAALLVGALQGRFFLFVTLSDVPRESQRRHRK
jgi:hypothetical protein